MIVVSKTFTTAETMLNARTMKDWLLTSMKGKASEAEITGQHMVSTRLMWNSLVAYVLGTRDCGEDGVELPNYFKGIRGDNPMYLLINLLYCLFSAKLHFLLFAVASSLSPSRREPVS